MKRKIARLLLVLNVALKIQTLRLKLICKTKDYYLMKRLGGTVLECVRSPFWRSLVQAKCDSVIKNQFHNKYLELARRNLYILSQSGIAEREVVLTHRVED